MFSFLVTYYNQQEFVERSLNSIFSQKLTEPFEVLVGDDGSSDATVKIVKEFQKKYLEKIILNIQERDISIKYNPVERASKNRLDLLKMAKGDYVCFLDGDDAYCDENWIQESIDILKKDKSLIGVAHNYCEIFPDGKKITPAGTGSHEYITSAIYCRKLYTPAGTIVFRNCFNERDYNKLIALKSFDDNDITFYFLNYGNLFCQNKTVYAYFQNENSIWNSSNAIEKAIINAIDYEIIKKIILKHHFQLFLKYFSNVYYVYKNINLLNSEKYKKYHSQALDGGTVKKLLLWENLPILQKLFLSTKLFILKVFHFIFSKIL